MRGLDFATIALVDTLAILGFVVAMTLVRSLFEDRNAWLLCLAGLILSATSSFLGNIKFYRPGEAVAWSYVGVALLVLGFSLVFTAVNLSLALPIPRWWNFAVAAAGLAVTAISRAFFPQLLGLRTLVMSLGAILMALPIIALDVRDRRRIKLLRLFDAFLAVFCGISALRLLFAFFDMPRDNFIPGSKDAWLFLGLMLSCAGALVVFMILLRLRRDGGLVVKSRLSLAERGLSQAEARSVLAIIAGSTVKEIAAEGGFADSTVRNNLARAYRKLGVSDMVGLMGLAARFEILP